jgi:hypothetical protein
MPAAAYIDVNNDGKKDLLVSPFDPGLYVSQNKHSVWLYLNQGENDKPHFQLLSKNFLQDQMIDAGSGAYPVFYDWDKDGKSDFILGNYGYYQSSFYDNYILHSIYRSRLSYYKNTGTTQQPQFSLTDTNFAQMAQYQYVALFPAFGDLNGDGLIDLLVGNAKGNLIFMQNRGNTQFERVDTNYFNIQTTGFSTPVLFDLDKDGLLDLIIGQKGGTLSYYHNEGNKLHPDFKWVTDSLGKINVTNFQLSYAGYSTPCFFRDSIGNTHLVVGSEEGKVYEYTHIDGNIDGAFTPSQSLDSLLNTSLSTYPGGIRTAAGIADLNLDGKPELLLGNFSGGLEYLQSGFTPSSVLPFQQTPSQKLKLFPNPANRFIRFQLPQKQQLNQIRLFDNQGKCVYQNERNERIREGKINIPSLPNGLYLLIISSQHQLYRATIVVQQSSY